MSHPFSSFTRRRLEPSVIQQALRTTLWEVRRHAESLFNRGKRNPRAVALTGVALVVTLGGAYALNASGRSMCPPPAKVSAAAKTQKGKTAPFLVLMDPVPTAAAGSELRINYDVCGLPSGTAYKAKVQLQQQQRVVKSKKKKKGGSPQPKPVILATFEDETDGPASRKRQTVELGAAKPGAYMLELVVIDNKGRARKKAQKIVLQKP